MGDESKTIRLTPFKWLTHAVSPGPKIRYFWVAKYTLYNLWKKFIKGKKVKFFASEQLFDTYFLHNI